MTRRAHERRRSPAMMAMLGGLVVFASAIAGCTLPATEVIVAFHSDAPENRVLNIKATVRAGSATTGDGTEQRWTRGGAGGITLPATFAIVPGNGPRDGVVTLVLEAELLAGAAGEPTVTFRRIARFSFSPRVRSALPIFLAASCGSRSADCTSGITNCTVSARCEELGQTCGDDGACVSVQVTPRPEPEDAGLPFTDISPRDVIDVPPAMDVPVDVPTDIPMDIAPDVALDVGPDVVDASTADVDTDAGAALTPPTQIAPRSTAFVTSRRPSLQWSLASGTDGARVELCRDRACTMLIETLDVTGTRATPTRDVTERVVFWRVLPRSGTRIGTRASPTWEFTPPSRSRVASRAWGTVLDVNGDGYADVAAAAPYFGTGRVNVYHGGPLGITATIATVLTGSEMGGEFGISVASAGDVNGDGFSDLIVGSTGTMSHRGAIFLYLGGTSGINAMPAVRIDGPDGGVGEFGYRVASAGDVNGDGRGDVMVTAPAVPLAGSAYAGKLYIYLGTATGIAVAAQFTMIGTSDGGYLGDSVAALGDVDGDGFEDVAVSAPHSVGYSGRVFLLSGSAAGITATAMITILSPMANGERFGDSLACAGDVNGDGVPDLFVGASQEAIVTAPGRGYLYLGTATGMSTTAVSVLTGPDPGGTFGKASAGAGDINGDGFDDVVVGAYQTGSSAGKVHILNGNGTSGLSLVTGISGVASSWFGFSVAGAGDTNLDGFMDVIVGAPTSTGSSGATASVYIGRATGIATTPFVTLGAGLGGGFGFSVALAAPRSGFGLRGGMRPASVLRPL